MKPNRPLPLRHCAGAKGLCSSICFGSASDHSCLAHQQRPASKRQRSTKLTQAAKKAKVDSTDGFLCGLLGDEQEGDALDFESLRQLCDDGPVERLPSPCLLIRLARLSQRLHLPQKSWRLSVGRVGASRR